jgi:adenosylhomocysteine nucleosidase
MIGIIGAMEEEVELLLSKISEKKSKTLGPFSFTSGKLGGKDVVVLLCGIGKVNAGIGAALMLDNYHPVVVINTGSAGGLQAGKGGHALAVGDIIVADGLVQHDVDVTGFGYELGQVPKLPAVFTPGEGSIKTAIAAAEKLKAENILPAGTNISRGLIVSGDVFMNNPQKIDALKNAFPKALAVEMEGAAIAQAAYLFGIPFLVIRSLSDIAGTESACTFDEFLHLASKNSANLVCALVDSL